jgi:simple sugar transport system substrate-binding protein
MDSSRNHSRRNFLQLSGTLGIAGIVSSIAARAAYAADPIVIGIIYVGAKDDYGYNQAHAVGAEELKKIPNVTVVEEENVPETIAVQKTMESMINLDGAQLILATSFGYFDPHMLLMAKKYPNVQFRHAAGLWDKNKHPMNAGSYFGYLDQAHYVNGVAGGLMTKVKKIGFVAAKPIPSVLRNINSAMVGIRKNSPDATIQVIFTGDWSLPVREAEATNALVDAGCDIITCHVDGPKVVIQTAEQRGVMTLGHNASQATLAPKGFITGAEYKWATVYKLFADDLETGKPLPNWLRGGYDVDYVQSTPFGAITSPEARAAATAAIADLKVGKPIFVGPFKDNKGNVVGTKAYDNYDIDLESMDYLIDGVQGSTT